MAVEILFSVAVLLMLAKIFGEIAERLGLTSLVGELSGGFLALQLKLVSPDPVLGDIANLGMLLSVFLIGLSLDADRMKAGIFAGSAGAAASFAAGFLAGNYFFGTAAGIVAGMAALSTSSGIAGRFMASAGELHSRAGKMITSANMAGDIIAVVAFSAMAGYFSFGEPWKSVAVFFLLLVAAAAAVAVSKYLSVVEEINDEQFIIAAVLVMIFLLSYGAQASGVAAAAGAFIAGLILNKTQFTESVITPKIGTISHGFFIPLFFAYSALLAGSVNVQFALALLVAAGLAKFLVSAGAGSYHGLNRQEQATFGISMLPRGEISVIACYVALSMGIISAEIYSSLLSFVVLSIVSTAVLFRALVKRW